MDSSETTTASETPAKPKKKKLVLGLSVLLVALLGGGGFFYWQKVLHGGHAVHSEEDEDEGEEGDEHASAAGEHGDGHGDGHHAENKAEHKADHEKKEEHDPHGAKESHAASHDSHAEENGHETKAHSAHGTHEANDSHAKVAHEKKSSTKKSKSDHASAKEEEPKGVFGRVAAALEGVHEKVVAMHHAEVNNERLKLENMNLRQQLERLRFEGQGNEALKFTHDLEMKLSEEAGTKVARTLASIRYKPPEHLLPVQLYTLAVTYFKGREDEKAAVLLTYLTGLEENDTFKNSKNFLMTAVTWYRLDHFELADHYLKKVLDLPKNRENQAFQAQARLWKGILSERQGKHVSAQNWLKELVDNHPNSREAGWVNGGVPAVYLDGRTTASTPKSSSGLNEVDHDEAEDDEEEE